MRWIIHKGLLRTLESSEPLSNADAREAGRRADRAAELNGRRVKAWAKRLIWMRGLK
jgi:hypothetical protein